jgi:SAM-dependent methyltransferase
MNVDWLTSAQGQELIAEAKSATDPLIAIPALRKKHPDIDPNLISEALSQAQLQNRLAQRWNVDTANLILSEDGIMQATRPAASSYRAELVVSRFGQGAHVLDLTCGLGFDSLAFAKAGLQVTALEINPEIAAAARFNLRQTSCDVITADCLTFEIPESVDVVFVDPARRDPNAARRADGSTSRIFNPEDWSPSWDFVLELSGRIPVVAKVAPGFDTSAAPTWNAEWISIDGDLVETLLMPNGTGEKTATLIDSISGATSKFAGNEITATATIGKYLVVPDAALIRASALTNLADSISGGLVNEHIAWLTSRDETAVRQVVSASPRPALGFEILEAFRYSEKSLSASVKKYEAAGVTIMTRGMQLNVEALRKLAAKSAKKGTEELVVAIYREDAGPQALLCRRLA